MHSLAMTIGNKALALKEFKIDYNGPKYVHIVARASGLISWILTVMGIDITTVFDVYSDRIEFQQGSLSGQIQTVLPMRSISIASTGYTKPILLFVLAFLFFIIGIVATIACLANGVAPIGGIVPWLIALVCIIFYFLNKSLLISVVSNSSWPASICFKRSIIEGVKIEQEQAQEAINIINQLLMQQTSK